MFNNPKSTFRIAGRRDELKRRDFGILLEGSLLNVDDFTHFTQETTKVLLSGQGLGSDRIFPALSWRTNTVLVPCATSPPSGRPVSASTPDLQSNPRFYFVSGF